MHIYLKPIPLVFAVIAGFGYFSEAGVNRQIAAQPKAPSTFRWDAIKDMQPEPTWHRFTSESLASMLRRSAELTLDSNMRLFALPCDELLLPCAIQAQPAWKAVTTDDGVWVQEGDTKVLFYQRRLKSKDGKLSRANYVHPLLDLDGEPLTEDFPADHLHHRGIFWAWHQVTIGGKAVGDPWALKDCGWDIRDVKADSADDALSLRTEVDWLSPQWHDVKGKQTPFVRERAVIKVHRAEKERRVVDFEIGLTALQPETRIGGAAPTPGYGGFSPRLRLPTDVRFFGPKGEVQPLAGPVDAAAWMDVAGTFAKDRISGVAILIHPATPGFPQSWILRRRGSMQNPVYPGATPITLPTAKALVLRYRLVIHRKAVDADQIERWHREYAQVPPALGQVERDGVRHVK